MGVPINYGICHGGPHNMKHLADHREVFRVAVDPGARKAYPAMQASIDPTIKFGAYHFDGKAWNWQSPDSE